MNISIDITWKGAQIISIEPDHTEAQKSSGQVFCLKLLGQSLGSQGWTPGGPRPCLVTEKQLGISVGTLPLSPSPSFFSSCW